MTKEAKAEGLGKKNKPVYDEEMSTKEKARHKKVERRRSIEEYIARKRWKEENADLAELYEAEYY